jgi:hypothetical protein
MGRRADLVPQTLAAKRADAYNWRLTVVDLSKYWPRGTTAFANDKNLLVRPCANRVLGFVVADDRSANSSFTLGVVEHDFRVRKHRRRRLFVVVSLDRNRLSG